VPVTSYTRLQPKRRVISKFGGTFGSGIPNASVTRSCPMEPPRPFGRIVGLNELVSQMSSLPGGGNSLNRVATKLAFRAGQFNAPDRAAHEQRSAKFYKRRDLIGQDPKIIV